jgi:hypothetical protein
VATDPLRRSVYPAGDHAGLPTFWPAVLS